MADPAEMVAVAQAEDTGALVMRPRDAACDGIVPHHLPRPAVAVADEERAGVEDDRESGSG